MTDSQSSTDPRAILRTMLERYDTLSYEARQRMVSDLAEAARGVLATSRPTETETVCHECNGSGWVERGF